MSIERIEDLVFELEPEELPDALHLLDAMERVGWASHGEAHLWRGQIVALGIYQEDSRLWLDGPQA